jgi:hypothetical protein
MTSRFVLVASGDQFSFNLKAGSNETIVRVDAPNIAIDDQTCSGKAVARG